jgi:hypothetical protein
MTDQVKSPNQQPDVVPKKNWLSRQKQVFYRLRYVQFAKIIKAYFVTRFLRLIILWAAVLLAGVGISRAVTTLSPLPCGPLITPEAVQHYAEGSLLIVLLLGTIVVLLAHRLITRMLKINDSAARRGESMIDAVMDEISAASSHYACISIWVSFAIAISGHAVWAPLAVLSIFVSIVLSIYTFDAKANCPNFEKPIKKEYEVTLQTENSRETVFFEEAVTFNGSMYKTPPDDYETWLVRRWEENGQPAETFHPVTQLKLMEDTSANVTFTTNQIVWGRVDDARYFEVWVVGTQGKAVFDAWSNGNTRFVNLREISGKFDHLYPGLTRRTSDMIKVFDGLRLKIKKVPPTNENVAGPTSI